MEKNTEFVEKLVHINRITKVVKGGRRFGFSALVVVGNQNGKIGNYEQHQKVLELLLVVQLELFVKYLALKI